MTKQEAIKWVDERMCWGRGTFTENHPPNIDECWEAGCMAIEALQDDWVPVSEPPKENGDYIVSLEDAVDTSARFFNGKWFMSPVDSIAREYGKHEVIAWRSLPKPYKMED